MSNLAEQIREALSMFARNSTEPALIGGLAVVAHQVVRATEGLALLYAHRLQTARLRERCNANARLGRHSRIVENTPHFARYG